MFEKIKETEERYHELETFLGQPEIIQDQERYRKYAKEHSVLTPIINVLSEHRSLEKEIDENRSLLEDPDPEIKKLAREEMDELNSRLSAVEDQLKVLLLPKDPNDDKNILLEIRAGHRR
jgi:peptide chain release factor 1